MGTEGDEVCCRQTIVLVRGASYTSMLRSIYIYIYMYIRLGAWACGQPQTNNTSSALSDSSIAMGNNCKEGLRTSLLLLESQFLPVGLHAVPQGHPEVGLLLRVHVLPSSLKVGKRRARDGVFLADLLLLSAYEGSSTSSRGRWDE